MIGMMSDKDIVPRMKIEFRFYPASKSDKLHEMTRALVLTSDDKFKFAVWDGEIWIEEGSLVYSLSEKKLNITYFACDGMQ